MTNSNIPTKNSLDYAEYLDCFKKIKDEKYVHTFQGDRNITYKLTMAIDLGTNNTRIVVIDTQSNSANIPPDSITCIPNECAEIPLDNNLERVVSANTSIYDNLEIIIEKLDIGDGSHVNSPYLNGKKFLYGSLLSQAGKTPIRPSTANNKLDQPITTTNILTSIAVSTYLQQTEICLPINKVVLDLGLLLPPTEVKNKSVLDFLNAFVGRYKIILPRLNYFLILHILPIDANKRVRAEASSVFKYYLSRSKENLEEYKKLKRYVIAYDIGAGTNDISVLYDGEVKDGFSDTYKHAGRRLCYNLQSELGDIYLRGLKPSYETTERALVTGEFTIGGGEPINIMPIIHRVKQNLANELYDDLLTRLSSSGGGISPADVYSIFWIGKTCKPSGGDNNCSVIYYVSLRIKNELGLTIRNIDLSAIENPNLIGLALEMYLAVKNETLLQNQEQYNYSN